MRGLAALVLLLGMPLVAQGRDDPRATAAAALRAGEVARAIDILRRHDPHQRDAAVRKLLAVAHAQRGAQRFANRELEGSYEDLRTANRLRPGDATILANLGIVSHERGRGDDAERYMQQVLKLDPQNPHALAVLAELAHRRDRVQTANRLMQRAAAGAPGREDYRQFADQLGREAEVEKDFAVASQGEFRIHYQKGEDAGVEAAVGFVRATLDEVHRELTALLGPRPVGQIAVVVYTEQQFRRVRTAHAWARACYDGKLRVWVDGWPRGRDALRRDLRHELTHAFLEQSWSKTPLWLHEGLAQIVEGRSPAAAHARFHCGADALLPLPTFSGRFADERSEDVVRRGYAQSLMVVGHLQRVGAPKDLRALLRLIQLGQDPDRALQLVYRKGLRELVAACMLEAPESREDPRASPR